MSIKLETTKNGKPNILFRNYKYRESHKLKSGEIVWRCLGRICSSTIKTDENQTTIISSNLTHKGPHPVTMRTLTPQPSTSTPNTTPSAASNTSTPRASPSPASTDTPVSSHTPTPAPCCELQEENIQLRSEVDALNTEMKNLLDHTIENDTRLLEFTEEVFLANTPREIETPECAKIDRAVQCEPPPRCQDPRCTEMENLVQRLKISIEVLEAEICTLKNEAAQRMQDSLNTDWYCIDKKRPTSFFTTNKFDIFNKYKENVDRPNQWQVEPTKITKHDVPRNTHTSRKKYQTSKSIFEKPKKKITKQFHNKNLSNVCKIVNIEGDSHCRHLASLIQERLPPTTRVSGICKPGAKLREVTSGAPPPPGSYCVLTAGTNDIAAGQDRNIYQYLEPWIVSRLETSRAFVCTIPHRHDLPPGHPVNRRTAEVNHFIEELCARYESVHLFDFNNIKRRWFTRQGMHLRISGKQIMANAIVRWIQNFNINSTKHTRATPKPLPPKTDGFHSNHEVFSAANQEGSPGQLLRASPPTPRNLDDPPWTPRQLPHETYSDALKSQDSAVNSKYFQCSDKSKEVFLGTPVLAPTQT